MGILKRHEIEILLKAGHGIQLKAILPSEQRLSTFSTYRTPEHLTAESAIQMKGKSQAMCCLRANSNWDRTSSTNQN